MLKACNMLLKFFKCFLTYIFMAFLETLETSDKATDDSECQRGASGFLTAIPSKTLGLALESAEFLVEVRTRLLMDVYSRTDFCPCCDCVSDSKGHHARLCAGNGCRVLRHNATRNRTGKFAASAGLGPVLENPGLPPPAPDKPGDSLRRPADVYLPTWNGGCPAALDFAVSSPHRLDFLTRYAQVGGSAAVDYEETKRHHLNTEQDCARQGVTFIPMVAEPSGSWGPSAVQTFAQMARISGLQTDADPGPILGHMYQALCVTIRRASARAVLWRCPVDVALSSGQSAFEAARAHLAP